MDNATQTSGFPFWCKQQLIRGWRPEAWPHILSCSHGPCAVTTSTSSRYSSGFKVSFWLDRVCVGDDSFSLQDWVSTYVCTVPLWSRGCTLSCTSSCSCAHVRVSTSLVAAMCLCLVLRVGWMVPQLNALPFPYPPHHLHHPLHHHHLHSPGTASSPSRARLACNPQ